MHLKQLTYFDFEITTRCNLKCKYCYLGSMTDVPRVDMSDEVVEDALTLVDRVVEARGGKQFTLYFYGGEPLVAFERMKSIVGTRAGTQAQLPLWHRHQRLQRHARAGPLVQAERADRPAEHPRLPWRRWNSTGRG